VGLTAVVLMVGGAYAIETNQRCYYLRGCNCTTEWFEISKSLIARRCCPCLDGSRTYVSRNLLWGSQVFCWRAQSSFSATTFASVPTVWVGNPNGSLETKR